MHTNPFTRFTNILFAAAFVVLVFGTGYKLGQKNVGRGGSLSNAVFQNAASKNEPVDFSQFWEVWDLLTEKYVDQTKLNSQKMFYGAVKGMVASLDDPYTVFLTPEENKLSKDDLGGKFEGIGAQLGLKNGQIVVIAPLKDSPAEKAGVRAGDAIVEVDGKSTAKWTLFEAVSKIRGKDGTKVALTLDRSGKEVKVSIARQEISVASVETTYEKNIAVIKLTRFGDDTQDAWDKATQEVEALYKKGQVKAMILDMRDNPGGYLEGSVYISSEFLPFGSLVVTQEQTDKSSQKHTVLRRGKLTSIPLVVLVNKGSASAAEIVAGALQDHKRAKLVGEKTFGKGSVQEAVELKKGAGIHITVAKWILPKGTWINSKGVTPDVLVEVKEDEKNTITRQTDIQLEKALEVVLE